MFSYKIFENHLKRWDIMGVFWIFPRKDETGSSASIFISKSTVRACAEVVDSIGKEFEQEPSGTFQIISFRRAARCSK